MIHNLVRGLNKLPEASIAYFNIGADPLIIDYLAQKSDGLVIAGAGCGTFSSACVKKIEELEDKGIPVVKIFKNR